jgi:catechol 2,3-dioxygenase-like lactoylglutathione lyase family enzyme
MELGWCDVCLKVASAKLSREFYEKMGFRRVEGEDSEGWAVVTNGEVRLGLYEAQHMGKDSVTLNFRGGNVPGIREKLEAKGLVFEALPSSMNPSNSAIVRDPDGYSVFFDTAPGERKKE